MRANQVKKILVAGGAGFLGSHLCETLLKKGHQIICVDNFMTGSKDNIAHLIPNPSFQLLKHDVLQPLNMQIDEIYNLACPASPKHYQRDPILTNKISLFGALNLLELAQKNNATILQASTSEVYGDPLIHPQPESYHGNVNQTGPRACYDEGKRCAETLFLDFQRTHGTKIRIARIFNTYGPRMKKNDGRVISNFIFQALNNQPITIYGKGEQTRSFCYVDDLIQGLILLMESTYSGPLNLGNPQEFTIQALAELVLELTHSHSTLKHETLPEDDPKVRCPNILQAKTLLGWEPTIDLHTGLQRTIEYFSLLESQTLNY